MAGNSNGGALHGHEGEERGASDKESSWSESGWLDARNTWGQCVFVQPTETGKQRRDGDDSQG